MSAQRRRGRLPGGERRTDRTGPIDWAPTELAVVSAAADARNQSVTTFIADAALGVAAGKYAAASQPLGGLTAEQVTLLRAILEELMTHRRLLANATGLLNQIAAASNSGAPQSAERIAAAVRYLVDQVKRVDQVSARLADAVMPD
ncbi:hypothetical protein [Actinokineospora enzanensis]|uniref:hypothetical protein n=1 Tax=Actinokineospora enzanensis TaxID=155975 RepID=UPI0003A007BC|nr:hypothetical protein [Actinokineospora enzanensis]